MSILTACMSEHPHICSAQGGQKKISNPLGAEIWIGVRAHVGSRTPTRML